MYEHVFYTQTPQTVVALDYAVQDDEGQWRALYGGQTGEELQQQYPGARVASDVEYRRLEARYACTTPQEVTEQCYHDALNALPPRNTAMVPGSASFMLGELYADQVAVCFVMRRETDGSARYFSFRDLATSTHRQLLSRVSAVFGEVCHA